MLRAPTFLNRFVRTMTAFATVWCLGCSSYEPMLDALLGSSAGAAMMCDSEGQGNVGVTVAASTSATPDNSVAAPNAQEQQCVVCGCQSCHAPTPTNALVASLVSALPGSLDALPSMRVSVTREPLVPPPVAGVFEA